jgi:hypothetical protein
MVKNFENYRNFEIFWSISKHLFQKLTKTSKIQNLSSYTISNEKIWYGTVESYFVYVVSMYMASFNFKVFKSGQNLKKSKF